MAKLNKQHAHQLIDFIRTTNYFIAPFGDGIFTPDEAKKFVDSDKYLPEEPLNVCFETSTPDYIGSAEVTHNNTHWKIENPNIDGQIARSKHLQDALTQFRDKHNKNETDYPVELNTNNGK